MIIFGIVASQQAGAFGFPPAIGDVWRLVVSDVQSGVESDPVQIAGITWLDAAGDPIDMTDAFHQASNSDGGNGPDEAFDGAGDTYWGALRDSGTTFGPQPWLQTTFNTDVEVRGIRIQSAEAPMDYAPQVFEVQFQTPGGSWLGVFKVYAQDQWDGNEERTYQMGGRIWRLVVNSTDEGTLAALGEVEFRSVADTPENHYDDGGFPRVSSFIPPDGRFNAFDNDNEDPWRTDTLPAWIEYWFPTTKLVEQIAVFTIVGEENQAPATTQLFYSDDFGLTYTEVMGVDVINVSGGYGYGYGYFYGGS